MLSKHMEEGETPLYPLVISVERKDICKDSVLEKTIGVIRKEDLLQECALDARKASIGKKRCKSKFH